MDSRSELMGKAVSLPELLDRPLLFVSGKGGVGKTAVSQAIALNHSRSGARVLWTTFEDPTRPTGELEKKGPSLWHLNCEAGQAFEEYILLKLGSNPLTRLFLQNKLMKYLSRAAPGIHELVLLGKVWHERANYDYVVVDMPSTGYGVAMFQSTMNFAKLFKGGPIHRDAEAMLATLRDSRECGHLIVSLPEEMPLRESLDLQYLLMELFPENPSGFILNRSFPHEQKQDAENEFNPLPRSTTEYIEKRIWLEEHNLRLWRERKIEFGELRYVTGEVTESLAAQLEKELMR